MGALLEVALLLMVGRALASLRRLPRDTSASLGAWVLYAAWPAAVLQSAQLVRLEGALLGGAAWLWLLFGVAVVGVALAVVALGWRRPTAGAVLLTSGAGSTAGFALPFLEMYCGSDCVAAALVLSVIGSALAFAVLGVAASSVLAEGRVSVPAILRRICGFPPMLAMVAGVALPAGVLPDFVSAVLTDVAGTLTPVAVVGIGMHLKGLPARTQLVPVAAGLAFRLILAPALALGGLALAGEVAASIAPLIVLMAAMPPPISAVAVAREYSLDPELSAQMTGLGSALALMTVPLWGLALDYFL